MGNYMSWISGEDEKASYPAILSMATNNPEYAVDQKGENLQECMRTVMKVKDPKDQKKLDLILKNSGIDNRFFSYPDVNLTAESGERVLMTSSDDEPLPLMDIRNEMYKKMAVELACKTCREALDEWGGDYQDITHIVYVTCTGMIAPGVEFYIMRELGLKKTVQRIGLNFMGCYGATRGLTLAKSFADQDPSHRVLLCCCELCSLQYQEMPKDHNWSNFIGALIFADGCGATVVGKPDLTKEKPLWYLKKSSTIILENTPDDMTYEAASTGFIMSLARTVPHSISSVLPYFLKTELLADENLPDNEEDYLKVLREFEYMIHPGGRLILDKIKANLDLKEGHIASSYDVLRKYGNMSSATLLFVMDNHRRNHPEWMKKKSICMAFGPGLGLDAIYLAPA